MKRWIRVVLLLIVAVAITETMHDGGLNPEIHASPSPSETYCTYYYGFNTALPPTDDAHVRYALSLAVDREALTRNPSLTPAKTLGSPAILGAPEDDPDSLGIEFDPQAARQELARAGYPGGAGLPRLTLMFNASENHQKIAQTIQAQWKEHLGIEVELVSREWNGYLSTLMQGAAPNIWLLGSCSDYADAPLRLFHSATGAKLSSWSNSEFDRLLDLILIEPDCAKREELYRRAEQILTVEDAAVIPVFHYPSTVDFDLGPTLNPMPPSLANSAKVRLADLFPLGDDEVIELENVGDANADLSGWQVQSVDRTSGDVLHEYVFSADYVLPVGGKVFIHSGPAAQSARLAAFHLLWLSLQVWDDDGNLVVLRDAQGKLHASWAYGVNSADLTEAAELLDPPRVCRLGVRIEF